MYDLFYNSIVLECVWTCNLICMICFYNSVMLECVWTCILICMICFYNSVMLESVWTCNLICMLCFYNSVMLESVWTCILICMLCFYNSVVLESHQYWSTPIGHFRCVFTPCGENVGKKIVAQITCVTCIYPNKLCLWGKQCFW